jgi:hypothetical protein
MRLAWLSALVASLALAIACRATAVTPPAEDSPYRATSTVRDIMQSVVAPSAQGLWDSVGTISNANGTFNLEPRTDAEWAAVRRHAVALVESTNLLVIPGRHIAHAAADTLKAEDADPGAELPPSEIEKRVVANWPAWVAMAHALHDSAATMLEAIDHKDVSRLESTGSDLDGVCESCHLVFWYPPRSKAAR